MYDVLIFDNEDNFQRLLPRSTMARKDYNKEIDIDKTKLSYIHILKESVRCKVK